MGYVYFPQFEKGKKGIRIHSGLTILEHARKSGIEINAECGGIGKCGKCVVRIEKGNENLNPPTDLEKNFSLKEDERLA
ncbi:MAG TPA: (2Fe-2S)-binding protein, partial [Firmicutes bacterium]|nr:(2Fe-2S)-binding protein [Bacillota bacterium]